MDDFDEIKVCVGYRLDGEIIDDIPGGISALERCIPIYESHPGWDKPTAGISDIKDLPSNARAYIGRLEELINCPVGIISTGPHRDETIMTKSIIQDF